MDTELKSINEELNGYRREVEERDRCLQEKTQQIEHLRLEWENHLSNTLKTLHIMENDWHSTIEHSLLKDIVTGKVKDTEAASKVAKQI